MSDVHRIDVVISSFNAASHIHDAVASALAQRDVEVQVFVVDGQSTDGTADIVRQIADPRVRVVDDRGHLSTCEARNLGVALGTSPWVSYLDADDMWPADRTRRLIAAMSNPARQIAYGHMLTFPDVRPLDPADTYPLTGAQLGPAVGTTIYSREVYERVGDLDESLAAGEFIDWMARARNLGLEDVPVPVVALLRRAHEGNATRDLTGKSQDYHRVVAAHRARQRSATQE